ncbi:hypothetical protein, partial [Helicobacter suis]|uniref:hypothetical protein n=1 Tax=Helicobacter suis TaxID=104628 RepID=UPI002490AA2D
EQEKQSQELIAKLCNLEALQAQEIQNHTQTLSESLKEILSDLKRKYEALLQEVQTELEKIRAEMQSCYRGL